MDVKQRVGKEYEEKKGALGNGRVGRRLRKIRKIRSFPSYLLGKWGFVTVKFYKNTWKALEKVIYLPLLCIYPKPRRIGM